MHFNVANDTKIKLVVTGKLPVIWKKAALGIREMCDICLTTIFNYHWACSICGFSACIDCVKVSFWHTSIAKELNYGDIKVCTFHTSRSCLRCLRSCVYFEFRNDDKLLYYSQLNNVKIYYMASKRSVPLYTEFPFRIEVIDFILSYCFSFFPEIHWMLLFIQRWFNLQVVFPISPMTCSINRATPFSRVNIFLSA